MPVYPFACYRIVREDGPHYLYGPRAECLTIVARLDPGDVTEDAGADSLADAEARSFGQAAAERGETDAGAYVFSASEWRAWEPVAEAAGPSLALPDRAGKADPAFNWFWSEATHHRWAQQRAKGRKHFIWSKGVRGWGVAMLGAMALAPMLSGRVAFSPGRLLFDVLFFGLGGYLFGVSVWHTSEKRYQRIEATRK